MDNDALKGSGPSFIGDLARMGGDVTGSLTNEQLAASGPSFLGDLARMGGTVLDEPEPLSISGTPVLTATEDAAYAGFTVSASGGTEPYTFVLVGTWPAGISINATTGAVSGTPTASGSFANLSVSVSDANSNSDQLATFTLVVAAAG
ncbi:Ig domain-containing protein [Xanthobacter sediminis]